ncbi:hypothetical protein LZ31DRAFT_553201, partial [Colletotrichum somersetense]
MSLSSGIPSHCPLAQLIASCFAALSKPLIPALSPMLALRRTWSCFLLFSPGDPKLDEPSDRSLFLATGGNWEEGPRHGPTTIFSKEERTDGVRTPSRHL